MASIVVAGDTSGSVTIAAPAIAGTPTLTLPTTTGTILTTTSPKAGNVIQVVSAVTTTSTSTTGSTMVDSGLSVSITPTSSSSQILVIVNQHIRTNKATDTGYGIQLVRGSTIIFSRNDTQVGAYVTATDLRFPNTIVYLDSPATTSSTTYKTQIAAYNSGTVNAQQSSNPSTITLMEIAA